MTVSNVFNFSIAASTLPAWLAGVPLYQWKDIPNSILGVGDGTSGVGLSSAFLATRHFSRTGATITWGVNKFGSPVANPGTVTGNWGSQHFLFGNMPWDRVNGRALFGPGDTTWPENGIHALELDHPTPVWVAEVVRATDQQDYKFAPQADPYNCPFDAVGHLNADGTVNDPRYDRMYDGRPRPSHMSWHPQYNAARNWLLKMGSGQLYPWDSGALTDVHIGDLNIGDWLDRDFQGYSAQGDPLGVTIPRIPATAATYGSIIATGPAAGQRVGNTYPNPCCISIDSGDMFLPTDAGVPGGTGPNMLRLTNSLIGTANPWTPLGPNWFTYHGVVSPTSMKESMALGSIRNLALGFNTTANYLLMMGWAAESTRFVTGIWDFTTPVSTYPCTFRAGDELGMTFTGAAASAVQGFNNFSTNNSQAQDWPVWNPDLNAFLWWESATGKVISMAPNGSWVMNCTYLPMVAGPADTPVNWSGTEYRRQGWDYIPKWHLMVFRGPFNAPIKCFRTA